MPAHRTWKTIDNNHRRRLTPTPPPELWRHRRKRFIQTFVTDTLNTDQKPTLRLDRQRSTSAFRLWPFSSLEKDAIWPRGH